MCTKLSGDSSQIFKVYARLKKKVEACQEELAKEHGESFLSLESALSDMLEKMEGLKDAIRFTSAAAWPLAVLGLPGTLQPAAFALLWIWRGIPTSDQLPQGYLPRVPFIFS